MSTHPRAFRVQRFMSGVDWSDWTFSYHPTLQAARKAALKYLKGEGKWGVTYMGHRNRSAFISQRRGEGRLVGYNNIEEYHTDRGDTADTSVKYLESLVVIPSTGR